MRRCARPTLFNRLPVRLSSANPTRLAAKVLNSLQTGLSTRYSAGRQLGRAVGDSNGKEILTKLNQYPHSPDLQSFQ